MLKDSIYYLSLADVSLSEEQLSGPLNIEQLASLSDGIIHDARQHAASPQEFSTYLTTVGVERLLGQIDRFDKVFQTEHGSLYMVTADGGSLRIKMTNHENSPFQYIMKTMYFLPEEQFTRMDEDIKARGYSALCELDIHPMELQIGEYQVGFWPLEFDMYGSNQPNRTEIRQTPEGKQLRVFGDTHGFLSTKMHRGHRITKIIK